MLYDAADPVISTASARALATSVKATGRCVLNFTEHSFLSKFDRPGENKWWLDEITCDAVAFLAKGTKFPVSEKADSAEGGEKFCQLRCTPALCPYDRGAPAPVCGLHAHGNGSMARKALRERAGHGAWRATGFPVSK